jgi:hypothetical protein
LIFRSPKELGIIQRIFGRELIAPVLKTGIPQRVSTVQIGKNPPKPNINNGFVIQAINA